MIMAINDPRNHPGYLLFDKEFPAVKRYKMIIGQEHVQENCTWNFVTQDESIFCFRASEVVVDRILVKDESNIYRFIGALAVNLKVNLQGKGWVSIQDDMQGFPCVYYHEDNKHIMSLYICNKIYTLDQIAEAVEGIKNFDECELSDITKDIVGEGWF